MTHFKRRAKPATSAATTSAATTSLSGAASEQADTGGDEAKGDVQLGEAPTAPAPTAPAAPAAAAPAAAPTPPWTTAAPPPPPPPPSSDTAATTAAADAAAQPPPATAPPAAAPPAAAALAMPQMTAYDRKAIQEWIIKNKQGSQIAYAARARYKHSAEDIEEEKAEALAELDKARRTAPPAEHTPNTRRTHAAHTPAPAHGCGARRRSLRSGSFLVRRA